MTTPERRNPWKHLEVVQELSSRLSLELLSLASAQPSATRQVAKNSKVFKSITYQVAHTHSGGILPYQDAHPVQSESLEAHMPLGWTDRNSGAHATLSIGRISLVAVGSNMSAYLAVFVFASRTPSPLGFLSGLVCLPKVWQALAADAYLSFVDPPVRVGWPMETKEVEDTPVGTTLCWLRCAVHLSYSHIPVINCRCQLNFHWNKT